MFSSRARWDLRPNDFTQALRQRRASGAPLVDLTESNPTRIGLAPDATGILKAIAKPGALHYDPAAFGLSEARLAVAVAYREAGVHLDASQIVLTASSSEAYAWILKLLCDPDDAVIVPRPSYPLFDDLAQIEAVRLESYGLLYDGRWHVDVNSVHRAIDGRTRAIFAVSPNNPTGSFLLESERAQLEQLAIEHDLALVVDEVFTDYVWDDEPDRVRCAAQGASVLTLSLGGLSKSVCLPQMKLGWIAVGGPESARAQALCRLEMIADTFLSVGTPVQHAVGDLLGMRDSIRGALQERILGNLTCLRRCIGARSAVSALHVAAGWYALLRVPRVTTDEAWAVTLLRKDGVVVHPGSFFGFDQDGYLVVSLIPRAEEFERGIGKLVERVRLVCE